MKTIFKILLLPFEFIYKELEEMFGGSQNP